MNAPGDVAAILDSVDPVLCLDVLVRIKSGPNVVDLGSNTSGNGQDDSRMCLTFFPFLTIPYHLLKRRKRVAGGGLNGSRSLRTSILALRS